MRISDWSSDVCSSDLDDAAKRDRVSAALKDPAQKNNRDHVDIIIALGMAKEGFDWIWCEHALTVGYRSSLTEIVQIIGRATRDAPGKSRSEEHTSELQSLMRISYAVFCLQNNTYKLTTQLQQQHLLIKHQI